MSDAVGQERVSRITGYKAKGVSFLNQTPNLPQSIAILGEANTANQGDLTTDPVEINSAQQAGNIFGYGSPIYKVMRILKPLSGDGVGGIPITVYPQISSGAATSRIVDMTITGTPPIGGANGAATDNATHTLIIGGRRNLDGETYSFSVSKEEAADDIAPRVRDLINNILGCEVTAGGIVNNVSFETKWAGATAQDVTIEIDTNGNDAGLTYAFLEAQAGSNTPPINASLALFGNIWHTAVVNTYGTVDFIMDSLENFNGKPDPNNPTGRYSGIIWKPFVAFTGSVADNDIAITDPRKDEVTIALCPAPLSKGHPMDAAANYVLDEVVTAQNTPHLDIGGRKLTDMPTPKVIGSMSSYDNRDQYVKKGNSTVDELSGKYQIQDFITTYHPDGEQVPVFRYVRDLYVDMNIRFGVHLIEQTYLVDKAIANDNDNIEVNNVIKPKQVKALIASYADDLGKRGLIADIQFMKDSITVQISPTNPNRLNIEFKYKRSGIVRIVSTSVEVGANFGNS